MTSVTAPMKEMSEWKCQKRNGDLVAFDPDKISKALWRCFAGIEYAATDDFVAGIASRVINQVRGHRLEVIGVEELQRFVIRELWALELYDAAEHYQNYREQQRKRRLQSPINNETLQRVATDQAHFPTDLQYYQFMSKFSRWNEDNKRRETWHETVTERVMPWLLRTPQIVGKLTTEEIADMTSAFYNLEATPAMRVVQMAGPALDRCNVGVFNCAYSVLKDIFAFPEMLYILMQGTGHGFSCESRYVRELPRIRPQRNVTPDTWKVEDSTEGWCEAYFALLERLWDGYDLNLDTSGVRKKGTVLKTKGGRSSGPEPFIELCNFARTLVKARAKTTGYFTDIDAHDLACMTGKIVQVGGVRRAAEISLSDLESEAMRNAKSGNWYQTAKQRTMANNSSVFDFVDTVPVEVFGDEWMALIHSKSGERGIFNRQAALRYSPERRHWGEHLPGCNPCAEILLRPFQFCNLSIAIARPWDTRETLERKVRIATIFGKIQSLRTEFKYIRKEWKVNSDEERLLGVDITGHADCPLLRFDNAERAALLRHLKQVVDKTDRQLSDRFGMSLSAANTTVKPSGDSAALFNCGSGVSPRYAKFYMRWVRESKNSPIAKFLLDSGVPNAPAPEAPEELLVFGFPMRAPEGAVLRDDMTAVQQFDNWLEWKENWAEHSVSATIYADDKEWLDLGAVVYKNIDKITGLSFLPRDNGIYAYAPNEELTEERYYEIMRSFPKINWAKLGEYEKEDYTEASQTVACHGGKCD